MGDVSVMESAVIRQLQHAILQLCNEHVSYEHSLQVLGVLCVTVDDQPRDFVVKLNNTLKRVDAVTTASDDRRVGIVRSSAPITWHRVTGASDATAACGSSATAGSSTAGYGDSLLGRQGVTACIESAPVSTASGYISQRKCHGRKQSNPVKVKTVMDEDDNDVDANGTPHYHAGDVLLIAPAEPSAGENDHTADTSPPSSPRLLHSVGGDCYDVDEEFSHRGRHQAEIPTADVGGSVRTILQTSMVEKSNVSPGISSCTPRSLLLSSSLVDTTPNATEYRSSSDSVGDKLRRNGASVSMQEAALNFSKRTADQAEDGGASPSCSVGSGADVKIKEEMHHPPLPLTYGLDLGGGHGGAFDMSSSLSVAAAAAALSQYVEDPAMLQSLTSFDQQRLALYTSLVTAAAASGVPPAGCNDDQPPPMSLLNGAGRNVGSDVPSSMERPLAMSSYAMSAGQLGNHLSMHRLPAIRRRESFERMHHSHQPPMKVKDIIMYDDSAPLHVQRGSRIEGDFMVDALHVEGRKRRRRTAEDTLSAEEIAEYMGTSTSSGSGQFVCRYCGELSTDLSRYFAHTLTAHGSFVCHQCGKSFTTKSSLLRHRPIHTGMRRFACSICRKSFYRKDKCKAHIKRHLGLTDVPAGLSSSPAGLPCSSGPATPQLPPSVDHQLFASGVGPVNLAV